MNTKYFLAVLLTAAVLCSSVIAVHRRHGSPEFTVQEGLKGRVPPLQHGHKELQGKYQVTNVTRLNETYIQVYADYTGKEEYYAMQKNELIRHILVTININSKTEMSIKITDRKNERFEVPYDSNFPHDQVFKATKDNDFIVQIPKDKLGVTILRNSTKEVIFDTTQFFFVYSDLYHQISISMEGEYLYGLGERRQSFLFSDGHYTFWTKDQYMMMSNGKPNSQTYGIHPMYLRREKAGLYHVVYLRNYNALQVQYTKGESLTFISVGGLFEFKIFLGDKYPETAVKQYHKYVNGYTLHPFWAHGFHQCRWGYDTSNKMIEVWRKYNELDLPIDTLWSDIDYMNLLTDFTIDRSRYNSTDLNAIFDKSDDKGVHWIPIIDAGIAINDVSHARGKEMNIYQKSNKTGLDLIGCVWPGKVNYPDFNNPKAQVFWAEGLMNITKNYNLTPSGFWIDMNEFSNFISGEIAEDEVCIMPSDPDAPFDEKYLGIRVLDFFAELPFEVGGAIHPLQERTMSMDAPKYNQPDAQIVHTPYKVLREFDFHNLNGFAEGIATNKALQLMGNQLPFVITRSQVAGSGQFVQHWTGDNVASWEFLKTSLAEIFNYNLFGMPMAGVDICGFALNTTAELCARWMQVGAFYPFSRNHNANDTLDQEPYVFAEPYVLSSSRSSLKLRYALVKQYYAYFVINQGEGTIFRPLFFNFPDDPSLLGQDQEFMIDETLLAIPVLIPSQNISSGYTEIKPQFPVGSAFYEFNNLESKQYTEKDNNETLKIPLDSVVPLFIREGFIVFSQFNNPQMRTRLLDNHFEMHVALKKLKDSYTASGTFITLNEYTDGNLISKCTDKNNCSFKVTIIGIVAEDKFLMKFKVEGSSPITSWESIYIDQINFYSEDLSFSTNPYIGSPFLINRNSEFQVPIDLSMPTSES